MNVNNKIEDLARIFPSQSATNPTPAKGGSTAPAANTQNDQAQLSVVATQVAQSASTSDVRLDKVAAIQSALQAGTYRVPASDVAQKMIDSMLETDQR